MNAVLLSEISLQHWESSPRYQECSPQIVLSHLIFLEICLMSLKVIPFPGKVCSPVQLSNPCTPCFNSWLLRRGSPALELLRLTEPILWLHRGPLCLSAQSCFLPFRTNILKTFPIKFLAGWFLSLLSKEFALKQTGRLLDWLVYQILPLVQNG